MCGICGKVSWDDPPERGVIERMAVRMAHRGPDAGGARVKGPAGLGHRRLSIIDVSEQGNQPMCDAAGELWIVFNGEIYNFQSIRTELQYAGYEFSTKTDTEVILYAYREWGVDCIERFNGMFAFALWDEPRGRLLLARDRLGKKPLFYKPLPDGGVVFASELKSLVEDPSVSREINMTALSHFLSLSYTLTPECIIKGVEKLDAAHYLLVERGKAPAKKQYWDLARHFINKNEFTSEDEAAEELNRLLDDSVALRMISDVPLGAFLSGGIDSSSIVAAMCGVGSAHSTHTFSIGFTEKSYSELPEARFAADLLEVQHRDQEVVADMASLLPEMVYYADEPFADTSMIPTYYLAEFARKHVTVCLSGDGGDEIFAGYETYAADKLHHYSRAMPGWVVAIARAAAGLIPSSRDKVSLDYKIKHFLKGHGYSPARAHYSWRMIFDDEEKRRILRPEHRDAADADPYEHFKPHGDAVADCHYIDSAMYVDIKTWLVDDILVKVDRMTMAHSLEARAPLLDYRLVEFAASLPADMKLKGLRKKHIFKESQKGRLPSKILDRAKRGFNAPVSHWVETSMAGHLEHVMKSGSAAESIFDFGEIKKIAEEHRSGAQDNGFKLFAFINLGLWLNEFMD